MGILVRPFDESIERGLERPKASVVGTLRAGHFAVTTLDQDIVLEALRVGIDESGAYAILDERSYELPNGGHLVVAYDDLLGAATVGVELVRLQSGAADHELVLGFWLQFDSDGRVDGKGSSHRGPAILAAVPR